MTAPRAAAHHGPVSAPEPPRHSVATATTPLTEREAEVHALALQGLTARRMAERLYISEATVRSHLASIYGKLGVSGRVELLAKNQRPDPFPADRPSIDDRESVGRSAGLPPSSPGSGPSHAPEPPRRSKPLDAAWRRPLLALSSVAVAIALAAFVLIRPDLPPDTTLASAQAEIAAGQVASLDIVDSTATITRKDGSRQRVEGLSAGEASGQGRLARAAIPADVPVSAQSVHVITLDLLVNDILPPLLAPLVLIVVAVWLIRRYLRSPV